MDSVAIRTKLQEIQGERSIRAFAAELGIPKSLLHEFLSGKRGIKTDPIFQALYRTHPEVRSLLEEHQRQVSLSQEAGGVASPRVPA